MVVRFILDRCASTVILYIGVLALLKLYGSFLPQYLFLAIFGLSTVKVIHSVFEATRKELQISALGGRAPRIRTWSPSNIGFIVKALSYFRRHENMELWQEQFKWAGQQLGKDMHYTAEAVVLGKRLILTADPQVIKALLHNLDDFGKGAHFQQQFHDFLGLGIFNTDGAQWQNSRSLLRPQFTKDRLSDIKVFEEHVQELLPLLKGAYPGAAVRVDDLFFRYTLDAAGHFLMGAQIESLKNADAEFATAFAAVQHTQAVIARAGSLDWAVPRGDFNAGLKYLNGFVERFIDKALALSPAELAATGKDNEDYTFLHGLAGATRDRKEIRDALVNILLAGRDTTACTLAWLFYELSRKPEIVTKLRADIDRHIGLDPSNIPTYEQLKSCRYLQHCITQTLMLHPIVPYNVRVAMRDMTLTTKLEDGSEQTLGILEGTQVGYSTLVMQNRADLFPEPSEKFAPYDEFSPERFEHWRPHPAQYIPFNAGPRICIGQSFAQTELQYTIVRIFQHFKTVQDRNDKFPGRQSDIVLQPAAGVRVAFST